MKQTMKRLPEQMLRDEAEMRAFYQSVGIRPEITELAIRASGLAHARGKESRRFKAADDLLIAVQN